MTKKIKILFVLVALIISVVFGFLKVEVFLAEKGQ